jgi:putative Mg2+ transporter-C (MgtC) family protein
MVSIWNQVFDTIRQEFSDLPDVEHATQIAMRLIVAAVLGAILGYEREQQQKAAGLRTHMLVALGSALFVVVPLQSGATDGDMTRVLQGLVAGIGFLGAGTIVKGADEKQVKGLTSAAGIWLTAAVGMTVGMGREATAVLSTALAYLIFTFAPFISRIRGPKND